MLNGSVNGTIEAGGYSYYLSQRTDGKGNLSTGTDYVLTSYQGDDRLVLVNNGAYIGVAAAAQMFDLSIHDRMGTRPYINPITGEEGETSMWIRQSVIHERSRDTSGQLSMRNTSAVTQMGGDIVQLTISGGGYAFAGAMAGWGTEDWKTRSTRMDASSRADIDGWMVGVYGGWHQNDPKNDRTGAYVTGGSSSAPSVPTSATMPTRARSARTGYPLLLKPGETSMRWPSRSTAAQRRAISTLSRGLRSPGGAWNTTTCT